MRRIAFLHTKDRYEVLQLCLRHLGPALKEAGAELVVVDDCSSDERVLDAIAKLRPLQTDRAMMTRGQNVQLARCAHLALRYDVPAYVEIDSDVVLGRRALAEAFEVAAVLSERHPAAAFLSWRRLTNPDVVSVGHRVFYAEPRGIFFADCLRAVSTRAVIRAGGPPSMLLGSREFCGRLKTHRLLARPQVEVQHLGYRAAAGMWRCGYRSWWLRGPCCDADTGKIVEVSAFDRQQFEQRMLYMQLQRAARQGRWTFGNDSDPPIVIDVKNVDDAALVATFAAFAEKSGRRRVLILHHGRWEGEKTRREQYGVDSGYRWVRVARVGYKRHPWLKEAKRGRLCR